MPAYARWLSCCTCRPGETTIIDADDDDDDDEIAADASPSLDTKRLRAQQQAAHARGTHDPAYMAKRLPGAPPSGALASSGGVRPRSAALLGRSSLKGLGGAGAPRLGERDRSPTARSTLSLQVRHGASRANHTHALLRARAQARARAHTHTHTHTHTQRGQQDAARITHGHSHNNQP